MRSEARSSGIRGGVRGYELLLYSTNGPTSGKKVSYRGLCHERQVDGAFAEEEKGSTAARRVLIESNWSSESRARPARRAYRRNTGIKQRLATASIRRSRMHIPLATTYAFGQTLRSACVTQPVAG